MRRKSSILARNISARLCFESSDRAPVQTVRSLDDIRAILAAILDEDEIAKRDRAIIAFAILTGARDKAIVSFRLKHVDIS